MNFNSFPNARENPGVFRKWFPKIQKITQPGKFSTDSVRFKEITEYWTYLLLLKPPLLLDPPLLKPLLKPPLLKWPPLDPPRLLPPLPRWYPDDARLWLLWPELRGLVAEEFPLPRLMILSCWSSLASLTISLMKAFPNSEEHWRGLKRSGSLRRETNFGSETFSRFSRRMVVMPWKVWPHRRNAVSTALDISESRKESSCDICSRRKRRGRATSKTLYCSALRVFSFSSCWILRSGNSAGLGKLISL